MSDLFSDSQGRYQVECRLGEGGLGEVFRAYDNRLRRHVALKRLSPRDAPADATDSDAAHARAWREAIHLAALQHPNVVTVHDFDVDAQGPFLVMELVAGETLEAVVARGALPLAEFRVLARQSLEGLAAAHQVGIYHCDLKPSNLMLKYNALELFANQVGRFRHRRFFHRPARLRVRPRPRPFWARSSSWPPSVSSSSRSALGRKSTRWAASSITR